MSTRDPASARRPVRSRRSGIGGPHFTRAYTLPDDDWTREPAGSPVPLTASTPGVKRDGLDLRANGWRVDNYHRAGGPVLWQHDHTRPSLGNGRASAEPKRLHVGVAFDQEDEFARSIESKLRRRVLTSSSVGWDFVTADGQMVDHYRMSPERLAREAYYDLSELSIVNVPADPHAVAERQWRALRHLHQDFVDLHEAQERFDSDVTGPEIAAAVVALCQRLGIPVGGESPRAGDGGRLLLRSELPGLLRGYGLAVPDGAQEELDLGAPPWDSTVEPPRRGRRSLIRGAIPAHKTAVVDGEWDKGPALKALPEDRSALRAVHAWVDYDGDPDAKASYKFPHHATPGGPANLAAVRNGLARLSQADIPAADKAAVERHLRRHLDAQPDESRALHSSAAARSAAVDEAAARTVLAAFGSK